MSVEYEYFNKTIEPDFDTAEAEILAYPLTGLEWLRWDERIAEIHASFSGALSEADKVVLDDIIARNS